MPDSSAYQAIFSDICNAVNAGRILWKKHALERMMERGISRIQVKQAILQGSIIIILMITRFPAYYLPRQSLNRYMPLLLMTPHLNYATSLPLIVPI